MVGIVASPLKLPGANGFDHLSCLELKWFEGFFCDFHWVFMVFLLFFRVLTGFFLCFFSAMGQKDGKPLGTTGFALFFLVPIGLFRYPVFLTHSRLSDFACVLEFFGAIKCQGQNIGTV